MDRGPIRTRTTGGGMINSQSAEAGPAPKEEPVRPERAEPPVVHRASTTHHSIKEAVQPPKKRRLLLPIIAAVVIVLAILAGFLLWKSNQVVAPAIDGKSYQAVFFTNGQVYFGKLQSVNSGYLKLTDIFYLQTQSSDSTDLQATSNDQNNVKLVKLGSEIHGPQDEMVIPKEQILFYENLKADGKVAKSITQYKADNK